MLRFCFRLCGLCWGETGRCRDSDGNKRNKLLFWLDLVATLDAEVAYSDINFVVIATPTNGWAKFLVALENGMMTGKYMNMG